MTKVGRERKGDTKSNGRSYALKEALPPQMLSAS